MAAKVRILKSENGLAVRKGVDQGLHLQSFKNVAGEDGGVDDPGLKSDVLLKKGDESRRKDSVVIDLRVRRARSVPAERQSKSVGIYVRLQ